METIIAIDDNIDILLLIKKALEGKFNIKTFQNAHEALEVIKTCTPKLFILDIQMPEIDGYEVCARLKEMDSTKDIPIIFLSAKTGSNTRSLAFKLGAISYLEKPIEVIELRSLVNSIIKQISHKKENKIGVLDFELDLDLNKAKDSGGEYKITHSESIIMKELINNFGNPVSRERLASLFSSSEIATYRNIDTHISSIRKKTKNSSFSIITIYGVGYSMIELKKSIAS